MSDHAWKRVNRRRPCPVCGRPDWCLYVGPDDAPEAAICPRTESGKRAGAAGWLHRLREDRGPVWGQRSCTIRLAESGRIDHDDALERLTEAAARAMSPAMLADLTNGLGLSADALRRLAVGYSRRHRAFAFPMRNASGRAVGIRLRKPDGKKLSVKGGHEGLFLPSGLEAGGRLLITEGPTDCAALLDMGLAAVGRPSCTGGTKHLAELAALLRPDEAVIVADNDGPGRRGAERLAATLSAFAPAVRVIAPPEPIKDARAWLAAGARAADVERAIEAAPVRRLNLRTEKAGRRHGRR